MYIQQLYTNCLAQAAYYVESEGEALIIDPLREPETYLALAKSRNASIKYIFESHFHADFVSGHVELARQTGAKIIYGPNAKPKYEVVVAMEGEHFKLGKISIQVLHTPGHTIESSCFLLKDEQGKPHCVFTGDTLFAGDVGRPDLLSGNLDKETLAGMLFDSLQKLRALPDQTIVYPGHGAGSACGKNISKENFTTIGEQKLKNYAMKEDNKEEFIKNVTSGLPIPPAYFFKDAAINISGYDSYEELIRSELKPLGAQEFINEVNKGTIILDSRPADEFADCFIPGSINVGLNGDFAVWVGTLIDLNEPIILITEPGKEKETVIRLARIGFDKIKGYLQGGIDSWKNGHFITDSIHQINMKQLTEAQKKAKVLVLDVRRPTEAENIKLESSELLPLNTFNAETLNKLDRTKSYIVCCAGGYRSMIAISLMKRQGITNVVNLKKGVNFYQKTHA